MVKDLTNYYFDTLLEGLRTIYSTIDGSQKHIPAPPKFPWMYFRQLPSAGIGYTLSNEEVAVTVTYEVHIYSKKSQYDCRKIANTAREIMIPLGFKCSYFGPMDNANDDSINQFVMRYTKVETDN